MIEIIGSHFSIIINNHYLINTSLHFKHIINLKNYFIKINKSGNIFMGSTIENGFILFDGKVFKK